MPDRRKNKEQGKSNSVKKYFTRLATKTMESAESGEKKLSNMAAATTQSQKGRTQANSGKSNLSEASDTELEEQSTEKHGAQEGGNQEQPVSTQAVREITPNTSNGEALHKMEERLMAVLSKLESKVDNINQTTENMRQEFDSKLTQMSTDLKSNAEKTAALEVSVNFVHCTVEGQKEKIVKLETEAKHLKERVDTTQRYTKELKTEMAELKEAMAEKLNDVERRSREYSIRLRGYPSWPDHWPHRS